MSLNLSELIQVNLTDNQYFKEENPKNQIYIHHTAGNPSAINTAQYWQQDATRVSFHS